jgi:hypothetical protein
MSIDQVGPAWDEALAADRPVVIQVTADPEVPPLSPHITFEQAKAFMNAFGQGRSGPIGLHQGRLGSDHGRRNVYRPRQGLLAEEPGAAPAPRHR